MPTTTARPDQLLHISASLSKAMMRGTLDASLFSFALTQLVETFGLTSAALYRREGVSVAPDGLQLFATSGTPVSTETVTDGLVIEALNQTAPVLRQTKTTTTWALALHTGTTPSGSELTHGVLLIQHESQAGFDPTTAEMLMLISEQFANALATISNLNKAQATTQEAQVTLDSIQDALLTIDREWRFTYVNGSAEKLLRQKRQKLIGKNAWDVFKDAVGTPLYTHFNHAMNTGEVTVFEEYYAPGKIWFNVRLFPSPSGLSVYFQDVGDSRKSQAIIEQRATELQLVAQVSAAAARNLDVDQLLQTVADETKRAFKLYHAHVYLLDNATQSLQLAAGAGDPGRLMKSRGHNIPLSREHSLVARAARTRKGVLINDVRSEPDFLPNPLLPETRSEMSIPLLVGDRVLGVLDIQASQVDRFYEEDLNIQQTLADQIAVAVQNARLFTELNTATLSLRLRDQAVQSATSGVTIADATQPDLPLIYVNPAFERITGYSFQEAIGRNCRFLQGEDRDQPALDELRAALKNGEETTVTLRNYRKNGELFYNELRIAPLRDVTGRVTHFVGLSNDISERRYFEEVIQESASRAELLATVSAALSQAATETGILAALDPLAHHFKAQQVLLAYIDSDANGAPQQVSLRAHNYKGALIPPEQTRKTVGDRFKTLPQMLLPNAEPVFIEDARRDQRTVTRDVAPLFDKLGMKSAVLLPLKAGGEWEGVLIFGWPDVQQFNEETRAFLTSVQPTATSIVASRRAFLTEQDALEDAATLYKISTLINNAATEQEMVEAVGRNIQHFGMETVQLTLWENLDFDHADTLTTAGYWNVAGQRGTLGNVTPMIREQIELIFDRNALNMSENLAADPRFQNPIGEQLLQTGVASFVFAPMRSGERWVGQISFQSSQPRATSDRETQMLRSIAQQLTSAVERLALTRETEQRANELAIVADVSKTTATILNVAEMLVQVCERARRGFGLYHVHIYLLDDSGEKLVLRAGAGEAGRIMRAQGRSILVANPRSLVARAARERTVVIVNDVSKVSDFLPNPLLPATRAEMAVPMIVGDSLIGVLDVQSEQVGRFKQSDVNIKTALSEQVSVAVQNATLYEREVRTAAQLREVDRLKSEFLASMSHELRTPLNSIIGYAEVLADGIDGDLSEEAMIDVEAIHDSGQHLLGLINDILDTAKIEAGHMELDLEELDLALVSGEVERMTAVLLKDKPVDLIFDIPAELPFLKADHIRIRQILNNLVSNAIKFTDQGTIRVSAALLPGREIAEIRVQDSGVGIAPQHLGLIFEQFRQVDNSSTRRVGGTGLGLPITRSLIQMHSGEIRVESELEKGSVFIFTIPVSVERIGK